MVGFGSTVLVNGEVLLGQDSSSHCWYEWYRHRPAPHSLTRLRDSDSARQGAASEALAGAGEKEIDSEWVEEAEQRLQAYKEGKVQATPAEEVFRSLRRRAKS